MKESFLLLIHFDDYFCEMLEKVTSSFRYASAEQRSKPKELLSVYCALKQGEAKVEHIVDYFSLMIE